MAKTFGPVEVQGRPLHCKVCDHATFWEQEIELPTSFLDDVAQLYDRRIREQVHARW